MASSKLASIAIYVLLPTTSYQRPGSNARAVSHSTNVSFSSIPTQPENVPFHSLPEPSLPNDSYPRLTPLRTPSRLVPPILPYYYNEERFMPSFFLASNFFYLSHLTSTKIDSIRFAYSLIRTMIDSSRAFSLFLQPLYSPRLGGNLVLCFALINCRYFINNFSHVKSFSASSILVIIFITESFINEDTPDNMTSFVGYPSFRGNRKTIALPLSGRASHSVLTHPTLEMIQDSLWLTIKVSICVFILPVSITPQLTVILGSLSKQLHLNNLLPSDQH